MSYPTRWVRVATVAAAAGLALLTGAGTGSASPNSTPRDSNPRPQAVGDQAFATTEGGSFIFGRADDTNDVFHTGMITLTFAEGAQDSGTLLTYCIDLAGDLNRQQPYVESEWAAAGTGIDADRLAKILWILAHSRPNVPDADVLAAAGVTDTTLPKVDEVVYAGTQAAIWHFSDGMRLLPWARRTEFTRAQYDAIDKIYTYLTSDANTGQNGPPTLTITPATATGGPGDVLGPFTVSTSAPTVTLAATNGAQLLAADKATPVTSLGNGGQFFVKLGQVGHTTVTGTGQGFVAAGRAFVVGGPSEETSVRPLTREDDAQKLIAAELTPQQVSVELVVRSNVVATVTPTPTPTPSPTSPPLAATGASPMPKVWVALLLLLAGTGLTLAARRRRTGNHA